MKHLVSQLINKGVRFSVTEAQELKIQLGQYSLSELEKQELKDAKPKIIEYLNQRSIACLSQQQKRLFFLEQMGYGFQYHVPVLLKIEGDVQQKVLEKSVNYLVQSHESFRSNFVTLEDIPVQLVNAALNIPLSYQDCSQQATGQYKKVLQDFIEQPFKLEGHPLIRALLIKLADQSYVFNLCIHHIVTDGWSMRIVLDDLIEAYTAYEQGQSLAVKPVKLSYVDYSVWQQQMVNEDKVATDIAYWKQQLIGYQDLELPSDYPRPARASGEGGYLSFMVDASKGKRLGAMAKAMKMTKFSIFMTAVYLLLRRYSRQQDICMGMPVANRNNRDIENIVGFFVNTIVMRINPEDEQGLTVNELLKQVHKVIVDGQDHQNLQIEDVLAFLQPERDLSRTPVFQVLINYAPIVVGKMPLGSCVLEPSFDFDNQSSKFDLTFTFNEFEDSSEQMFIEYSSDLYDPKTIERMYEHLNQITNCFLDNPQQSINDIDLLTETDRNTVLVDWNNTQKSYPQEVCIHRLFEQQAQVTPKAIAVKYKGQQLTYKQLNQKSEKLAIYLQQQGVKPDNLVGICIERSVDMVVAVLAVLKAGAAYLPMASSNATDRIGYMLEDAEVKLLLTQSSLLSKLSDLTATKYQALAIDSNWETLVPRRAALTHSVKPKNLAYVIYTSGSTGQPKGVMVEHQALVNLSYAMIDLYAITGQDRILQFASLSFDMSVEEIFPYLIAGAGIVIREERDIEAHNFYKQVMSNQITILNIPPLFYSVIDTLSEEEKQKLFNQVRVVSLGGEALPENIVTALRVYNVKIFNAYGPTECTVNAAIADLSDNQSLSIGKPLQNTQLYVLGQDLKLSPVGIGGELYIAGSGLARGYLNRPELTAERFVANPFADDSTAKMYKTGDVVRWLDNGNLQFIGRADNQVKIRGFRVELGEIENLLLSHPQIEAAVVMTKALKNTQQLISYYTTVDAKAIETDDLKAFLQQKLPDYMIPVALQHLEVLPVTPNGKVDKNTLKKRKIDLTNGQGYIAPESDIEQQLAKIWEELLEIRQVGMNDNFFDLGGHSLLVVQLTNRINKEIESAELNVADIFKYPTMKRLLNHINVDTGIAKQALSPHIISLDVSSPNFIIPGMPGRSDGYYQLAEAITNDGETYGLQMQGYSNDEPATRVEDMAAHNIALIQQVKPEGKINLYAHSYGGTVVYEMLRQLERTPIQVGEIVLIDSGVYIKQDEITPAAAWIFCNFILTSAGLNPRKSEDKIKQLLDDKPYEEWNQSLAELLKQAGALVELDDFMTLWDVTEKALTANYTLPKRKLNYNITLVIAEQSQRWLKPRTWNKYYQQVKVIRAKGDHLSVVAEPSCSDWMQQLSGQKAQLSNDDYVGISTLDKDSALLSVRSLEKHYGDVKAVNGISFDLQAGVCFGLLGPNGAGKSTTIEMMEGILRPSNGDIYFCGKPIGAHYKTQIGIQFQQTALQESLTVRETLQFFQKLYQYSLSIDEIIEACSLEDYIDRNNNKLSGGQRQRLLLGIALINDPAILFLDEPTTGLDPQARHNFWGLIRSIKKRGKTIILTTHYMDEAEQLCDEIAIVDQGRIIARDTPNKLLSQHFDGILMQLPKNCGLLEQQNFPFKLAELEELVEFTTPDVEQAMNQLIQHKISLEGLQVSKPNLDDLFLKLTGHSLRA